MNKVSKLFICMMFVSLFSGCGSDGGNSANNNQQAPGEVTIESSNGGDFFVLRAIDGSGGTLYTGTNTYHIDKDGYVVNNTDLALQVFPVDVDGNVVAMSLSSTISLHIPNGVNIPQATDTVFINVMFPSGINPAKLVTNLDYELSINPASPALSSYHYSTTVTIFDSLGSRHDLKMFFVMTDVATRTWQVRATIDGSLIMPLSTEILDFDDAGSLDILDSDGDSVTTTNSGVISYLPFLLTNGAAQLTIALDFSPQGSTATLEAASSFSVLALNQNGFTGSRSRRVTVDENGLVSVDLTDLRSVFLGKIALAKFASPFNLQSEGNLLWSETVDSGVPVSGEANTGNFGVISPVSLDL